MLVLKNKKLRLCALITAVLICLCGCFAETGIDILNEYSKYIPSDYSNSYKSPENITAVNPNDLPEYSDIAYAIVNDNQPLFSQDELVSAACEYYSELDYLGRCGVAFAVCGKEIMPKSGEKRGNISEIKPTGWIQNRYSFVSGEALYNRCHLIGWQLSAENANSRNLITGTRYMNTEGMLPFENMIADYIKETGNHVAYRVTPVFEGENLLCSGVQMEAYSVEDNGEGICFNVYCYNVQPRIYINYATGENRLAQSDSDIEGDIEGDYVLNINSKKIHKPSCDSVENISPKNKQEYSGSLNALIEQGYTACGSCFGQ